MKKEGHLMDLGKISLEDDSEHFFINNMGAGFDALISYEVNHSKMKAGLNKLSLGRLVYVYLLLKKLFTIKPPQLIYQLMGEAYI